VNFIAGTIPPVREIVIVISDLYLAQGQPDGPASPAAIGGLPGIEHAARFGRRTALEGGWRPWLARWLGRGDLANVAPGAIVAAALANPGVSKADGTHIGPASVGGELVSPDARSSSEHGALAQEATTAVPSSDVSGEPQPGATSWIATPVHLIAGLTSLHLDRRSILRLSAADLESFARDFNHTFGDSGLVLTPLPGGEFLMQGPATLTASTTEPARALVADLEASLPKGNDAKALKRLGAELEMWLHANPLNETRRRRGELPVSTLWLWGGAPAPAGGGHRTTATQQPDSATDSSDTRTDLAFGNDPYLAGLWRVHGDRSRALPDQLGDVLTDSRAQRAVLATEVTSMLQLNPHWSIFEALAELDRRFVAPAIAVLGAGVIESVVLIANDAAWRVGRRDRLKLWRRPRPGISGLQADGRPQALPR
jgi:hypothetical protein